MREYAWGRCEPLSPQHSDTAALNALLFDLAPLALKKRTERCYLALRSRCLHKTALMRQDEVRLVAWLVFLGHLTDGRQQAAVAAAVDCQLCEAAPEGTAAASACMGIQPA